jgi:preprotein translocase subunit SecD
MFTYACHRDEVDDAGVWLANTTNVPVIVFQIRAADQQNINDYEPRKTKNGENLFVSKSVSVSNADIGRVRVMGHQLDGVAEFEVQIELSESGAERFANLTEDRIGKQVALLIDGVVQVAPVVRTRVSSRTITLAGFQSEEEATRVALGMIGIRDNMEAERIANAPAH